jgi:SCY1-like protein 1
MSKYPTGFLLYKVLPEMIKTFEFAGGEPKVLQLLLNISESLGEDDFEKEIQPMLVRTFASQERGVRMCLLDNLSRVIDRLAPKIVNDKIFPNLVFPTYKVR